MHKWALIKHAVTSWERSNRFSRSRDCRTNIKLSRSYAPIKHISTENPTWTIKYGAFPPKSHLTLRARNPPNRKITKKVPGVTSKDANETSYIISRLAHGWYPDFHSPYPSLVKTKSTAPGGALLVCSNRWEDEEARWVFSIIQPPHLQT